MPLADVQTRLASSPEGLSAAEATKRLAQYGPNEIEAKKVNLLAKFLGRARLFRVQIKKLHFRALRFRHRHEKKYRFPCDHPRNA